MDVNFKRVFVDEDEENENLPWNLVGNSPDGATVYQN